MHDACATPGMLSLEQALTQILGALSVKSGYERLPLKQTLNRMVYEDVYSAIDVPSFKNSSMDGYAMHSGNTSTHSRKLIGTSWAGKPYTGDVNDGECIRIFTGAHVPESCDCVVMQENVTRNGDDIQINVLPKPFENIRCIGGDIQKGQVLCTKNSVVKAADIGLLASCGIADVAVYSPVTVGFFSTGDELVSIGSQLKLGQIFDSNRYTLHALLEETGVIPVDMGVIPDNPDDVEAALLAASKHCDVIITSGGVSVGEADFIPDVIAKIGQIDLWKVAIKPGKPVVFGSINNCSFFGLPGNPVSVMVTYNQLVLPALHKLMGHQNKCAPLTLKAVSTDIIKKQPGRIEFQRGILQNNNGQLTVTTTGGQGSHLLKSMSKANCLIVLEQDSGNIEKGQHVTIQLLDKSL